MKEVDVRGLSCPEPVLIVKNELDKNSKENFKILASEAHVVKNVSKLLEEHGKTVSVKEVGLEYEISFK